MSVKQTIHRALLATFLVATLFVGIATPAQAQTQTRCTNGGDPTRDCANSVANPSTQPSGSSSTSDVNQTTNKGCEVDTAIISCNNVNKNGSAIERTGVWSLLITAINIMTVGVGVLAVAGIVYGGVLYTSAGGNPDQVKKARTMFTNVAIGVVAFGSMYALLNFLVPGGVFR